MEWGNPVGPWNYQKNSGPSVGGFYGTNEYKFEKNNSIVIKISSLNQKKARTRTKIDFILFYFELYYKI